MCGIIVRSDEGRLSLWTFTIDHIQKRNIVRCLGLCLEATDHFRRQDIECSKKRGGTDDRNSEIVVQKYLADKRRKFILNFD